LCGVVLRERGPHEATDKRYSSIRGKPPAAGGAQGERERMRTSRGD
jgi:hypothetical protein